MTTGSFDVNLAVILRNENFANNIWRLFRVKRRKLYSVKLS